MSRSVAISTGACVLLFGALLFAGSGSAIGKPQVAALQIALVKKALYPGPVDGLNGPVTRQAVRRFQRRKRLPVDGVADPRTRVALGPYGRPDLGSRGLELGSMGWDVGELQFLLAWHGFPSGLFDPRLGPTAAAALRRFQAWAGIAVDGRVGPSTLSALQRPPARCCPIRLDWPVRAPVMSPFGPRGLGFHSGIDLGASAGTPVGAAASGRISWASSLSGGWGELVVITHTRGVQTMYAHLSRIEVQVGAHVQRGTIIGLVGATGDARGPHLHFEVRMRGAAVDPLPALESR